MALYNAVKNRHKYDKHIVDMLSKELNITEIAAKLLINRGIVDVQAAYSFLHPSLNQLKDPFELVDMDKAVARINVAIHQGEKVAIYGDYDVDGVTASAILYMYLHEIGGNVQVYIPHRFEEGYGLNIDAIQELHADGVRLIITVDCGITSFCEIEHAKNLGMDVIVTDHHSIGDRLPPAIAVINPKRIENDNQTELAGVGVAAKLIHAIGGDRALIDFLDLIAIGTIGDMVPLVGDNRILTANGIKSINRSPRIGIKALMDISNLDYQKIKSYDIAFGIVPRLNAAGRMDSALHAFNLLVTEDYQRAAKLAAKLDKENKERKRQESKIITEAKKHLETHLDRDDKIIVLENEEWHPGIIGIAASKIVNTYNRPVILLTNIKDDLYTGSARSIDGFNIYEAISATSHILERFGGHKQAAGLTIREKNIPELKQNLNIYSRENIHSSMLTPEYKYDLELYNEDISFELYNDLEKFEPFGLSNPMPIFLLKDAYIDDFRLVGKDQQHIKLSIGLDGRLWEGIWFNAGTAKHNLDMKPYTNLIVNLDKNEWNGFTKLQFNVKSLKIQVDSKKHIDSFIDQIYLKFFDDFYFNFLYNRKYSLIDYCNEYTEISGYVDKNKLYKQFNTSYQGNVVLVDSIEIARALLFSLVDRQLIDRIEVGYGDLICENDRGTNGIVILPNMSYDRLNEYKNIFIFKDDILMSRSKLKGYKNRVWIIEDKLKNNHKYDFMLRREDFVHVYRWFQHTAHRPCVWHDMLVMFYEFNRDTDYSLNYFQFRLIVEIFKELNFLRCHMTKGHVVALINRHPKRRSLDESPLYQYHTSWLSKINTKTNCQKIKEES